MARAGRATGTARFHGVPRTVRDHPLRRVTRREPKRGMGHLSSKNPQVTAVPAARAGAAGARAHRGERLPDAGATGAPGVARGSWRDVGSGLGRKVGREVGAEWGALGREAGTPAMRAAERGPAGRRSVVRAHGRPEHHRPEHDCSEHNWSEHDHSEQRRSEHERSEQRRSQHDRSGHSLAERQPPVAGSTRGALGTSRCRTAPGSRRWSADVRIRSASRLRGDPSAPPYDA